MWLMGTTLWHIHGFSTDTWACMFLREPQHATAIGNVTVYDAHSSTLFLSLIWVHPPSRVLQRCWPRAPAEFSSVVVVLWVARFPREDAIDNIDNTKCAWHVNLKNGARGIQIQQERFNDRFSVQIQSANRHTCVATRLLRDGTRYREVRKAGLLPDNTNRRKLERTGQDTH